MTIITPLSPELRYCSFMNLGLVLTGGGARAAYQVGVIQAIADISPLRKKIPFNIITGASTGAINGSYLISRADDFKAGAQGLWDLWLNLHTEKVYRTDLKPMAALVIGWLETLGLGGFMDQKKTANHLLDTGPLEDLLKKELRLNQLPQFFKDGPLRGVGFSATNYLTGTAICFYDGIEELKPWGRTNRLGIHTHMTVAHIMASCAIPVFFPPVKINGIFYGDGCIRLTSPLSPAIHLGADRILAIGIRRPQTHQETIAVNQNLASSELTIAEISGVLLNSIFLDSLDIDIERMERINSTVSVIPAEHRSKMSSNLRHIPVLALRPSQDLGELAIGILHEFPGLTRHLLKGLGAKENRGWDLLSYLAFEKVYTNQLIELGYFDTLQKKELVLEFMFDETKGN
ncbi:MAG: patatin-like phospholipase family protein [Bdellovibrio sp.]|nr:patatin-like phospholipase family protein [Bdellovibrio sp.]